MFKPLNSILQLCMYVHTVLGKHNANGTIKKLNKDSKNKQNVVLMKLRSFCFVKSGLFLVM